MFTIIQVFLNIMPESKMASNRELSNFKYYNSRIQIFLKLVVLL